MKLIKPLRQMADNSFAWAAARGLVRTNEVHKVEEARLVLEETFENENEKGTKTSSRASRIFRWRTIVSN